MTKRIYILLMCVGLWSSQSSAELTIEITEGVEGTLPVAVVPFAWLGAGKPPQDVAKIVSNDLRRSGRFDPMAMNDMLAKPTEPAQIKFQNWRIMEIPALVIGKVWLSGNPDFPYGVEFRVYDVFKEERIAALRYKVRKGQLRKVAHQISDIVYEKLTGEKGAFNTRIAYIKKLPQQAARPYGLFIADSDTANEQGILVSRFPILSPTWSPDNKKLAYVKASNLGAGIYIYDVSKQTQQRVTPKRSSYSAPSWSPDGKKLAMMLAKDGSTDIYVMDLQTREFKKITKHWAIDTEPSWSPKGDSLIFTSERGGSAQLYRYTFKTQKIKRITFKGRQNLRAAHSPDGSMITFVHLSSDRRYHIAVMELDSGLMRIVSSNSRGESEHESPSFSPNGSMIIYAANYPQKGAKTKRTGLVAVTVDGRMQQHFTDTGAGEVREPAWSSFLN